MPVGRRKAGGSDAKAKKSAGARKPSAAQKEVFQPGVHELGDDEELDYDVTAYDCLHRWRLNWPCLSFDMVKDSLGAPRSTFPHTAFMVAGTQAQPGEQNHVCVMRLANIAQGRHGKKRDKAGRSSAGMRDESDDSSASSDEVEQEEEDDDDSGSEAADATARLHHRSLAWPAPINRVRCMPQQPGIVAVMDESAQASVVNVSQHLTSLADEVNPRPPHKNNALQAKAMHAHRHPQDGFAVDWSRQTVGALATGDCGGSLFVWEPREGGSWAVSPPYAGHSDSVEDVQWSPSEATVLATASVDGNVRIYDTRSRTAAQITVPAHETDVNVISWNPLTAFMLASGGDDGSLRIWDLRSLDAHVASFTYHPRPITSVEWCPHESSMLAASSEDNTVSVWDLALERDPEEERLLAPESAVVDHSAPAQLLFVHAGQSDIKEAHWHPQIPGMIGTTAGDGLNIFKPANVFELD